MVPESMAKGSVFWARKGMRSSAISSTRPKLACARGRTSWPRLTISISRTTQAMLPKASATEAKQRHAM